MHRQFFRLASSGRSQAQWEPPADVFEDEWGVVVVVALPGVAAEAVEVENGAGYLVVRAERALPFAEVRKVIRQLEIPYGRFERRIPLSSPLEVISRELTHGCLIVRLRRSEGPQP